MTALTRHREERRRIGSATRLAGFLALLLAAILTISSLETVHVFDTQSLTATNRNLIAELDTYRAATTRTPPTALQTVTVSYLQSQGLPKGESVMVGLASGQRLGSAGSAALLQASLLRQLLAHPPSTTMAYRSTFDGIDTSYVASPIVSGGRVVGSVIVTADLSQLGADLNRVMDLVAGEAIVALVAAVTGVYLLLRRLLRTVGRITTTAASIESGDLDLRLGDQGTDDEVGQLAATFDAMLDRLQTAMVVQRQLLSDVSHQLRTPLTVARGHLEVLARQKRTDMYEVRDTVAVVVDELDHMRALVERLMMLGRALEPDFLQDERLDLRTFLSDLFESSKVLAEREWSLSPVPDVVLEVDVAKLRGALLNLIDNAIKATEPGDQIHIRAEWAPGAGAILLTVDDSGHGIPIDQLHRVLTRFGRLGSADRDGSGLGLAIVTAVAEAHGGSFELAISKLGGCRATISIPAGRVSAEPGRVPVVV